MIRRASHEDRLRIAGEICVKVKAELGAGLRAFVVFASTAKNADGPYSDLELMAIVSDDFKEDACGFMYDDVYCEVYYVPFQTALKEAKKVDYEWPVSADQWHCMLPLYTRDGDDCLERIQTTARQSLRQTGKFDKEARGAMFAVQEDYGSLVNAWEAGVKSDVSTNLFNLSLSVIHVVAFVNRYFYQSLRNSWEEAKKLDKLPRDFAVIIDIVHGDTQASLEERYRRATELWQNMQGWMDELDIDWVSEGKLKLPGKKK